MKRANLKGQLRYFKGNDGVKNQDTGPGKTVAHAVPLSCSTKHRVTAASAPLSAFPVVQVYVNMTSTQIKNKKNIITRYELNVDLTIAEKPSDRSYLLRCMLQ